METELQSSEAVGTNSPLFPLLLITVVLVVVLGVSALTVVALTGLVPNAQSNAVQPPEPLPNVQPQSARPPATPVRSGVTRMATNIFYPGQEGQDRERTGSNAGLMSWRW